METKNKLIEIKEAKELINQDRQLVIAGNEDKLKLLPNGNWIGGTIPYFMDVDGGCLDKTKVFVTDITDLAKSTKICLYGTNDINKITKDRYSNGFSYILIPCFSDMLTQYAMKIESQPDLYDSPLIGWVTGIDLAEVGKSTPKVYNGKNGKFYDNEAIVMHVEMAVDKTVALEIINIFSQGNGDTITFDQDGFLFKECYVNGKKTNMVDYISENNIDTRLPLVADYSGALINTSFQQVNEQEKSVLFYAPLRKGVKYKLAKPVQDYQTEFKKMVPDNIEIISSCNCILNYLYSELEGKKTGQITGPFTFGEIAYVLVNQTLVYLKIL